jgi:Ca2+-binding EF-hand superfamily protein
LQKTLDDCGIYVNGDDLAEIMMTLDHDGNGEVDFDEFLNLMTNTDIFLEAISEGANEEMKKRHDESFSYIIRRADRILEEAGVEGRK